MKKLSFPKELCYLFGITLTALGAALLAHAGLGVSVIIAPAYLLSLKFEAVSFGIAEYIMQAFLLIVLCIVVRRFKFSYLLSFATALIYGAILDLFVRAASHISNGTVLAQILIFLFGVLTTCLGIAFIFNTYISPEVYELFVKVISSKFGFDIGKVKIIYDISSLGLTVAVSFMLFGRLEAIGIGTFITAVINGFLISLFNKLLNKAFDFKAFFKMEKYFEI